MIIFIQNHRKIIVIFLIFLEIYKVIMGTDSQIY